MKGDRDRGSVSLWLVIFAFAVLVLLGFVVDGGQYMNGREQAADIAQQAARAAVDDLSTSQLRSGTFSLNPDACQQTGPAFTLVSNYAGNGATIPSNGCVATTVAACNAGDNPPAAVATDPCVQVTVEVKVSPAIPIGPFGTFTAAATEQATLDCGNQVEGTGFC